MNLKPIKTSFNEQETSEVDPFDDNLTTSASLVRTDAAENQVFGSSLESVVVTIMLPYTKE
jgi:hypothetical protein